MLFLTYCVLVYLLFAAALSFAAGVGVHLVQEAVGRRKVTVLAPAVVSAAPTGGERTLQMCRHDIYPHETPEMAKIRREFLVTSQKMRQRRGGKH